MNAPSGDSLGVITSPLYLDGRVGAVLASPPLARLRRALQRVEGRVE
ncbi:MAG: hypothetical protein HY763_11605 [Planctomycetes bacterium]|nr:hypothetical protein [Planctomycetota bacterium]